MVCAISNKVIGFNISGISYASGGYRKADLVAADKQQRNDDSGSTGNSSLDASMLRLEITQDQIVKATRDVFHSLFHPECIGPPIRALQKYEIGKAVAKIRQEYKSSYNNYMTPNLLFILENQFRKFRNVTIAVPETLPQNYHSVCEYVVAVVTHCFKIRCIAQTQQQRLANRGQSEQANAGSKNPVNGKNTSGYTGSRRSTRKPVNVKLEPKAFALAVIYKMQTGYKFEERIVIPQSSFVSQHFPSVNVLKDVGLEKTGITKVSNVIVEYCSILQEVQMLDQLKFLPDASGTTPVNNVLLGKEGAPDRPTAMLKQ